MIQNDEQRNERCLDAAPRLESVQPLEPIIESQSDASLANRQSGIVNLSDAPRDLLDEHLR